MNPQASLPQAQAPVTPDQINLRAAVNPQMSCTNCGNYDAQSTICSVLRTPVQPTMVSDAWTPQGAAPQAGPPADLMSMLFGGQNGQ